MQAMSRRAVLGCVGLVLAGTAVAQPMGPGPMRGAGPGAGRGGGPGLAWMSDPGGYMDGLKGKLAITPDQQKPWDAYAETVVGVAGQMKGMHDMMGPSMQSATWEERRDKMNMMFDARTEAHRIVQEAAQKLLPSLTPDQRTQAATILPGLVGPGPGGMGMGRGMGGGGGMGGGMGPPRSQ